MSNRVIEHPVAYAAAVSNNIRFNAQKTFYRTHEDAETLVNTVMDGAERGNAFFVSLLAGYNQYGRLTEGQVAAVRRTIEKTAARKAEWAAKNAEKNLTRVHIGEVGKRMNVKLTCKKVITYNRPQFHYYDNGVGYINIAEDEAGNVFVYRGESAGFPNEGETAMVKFTVKEHAVYNGTPQTVINRPSIVEEK
jgi:hypothetical protein